MGYFASRSAPMGAVPGEVVIATFFNFAPEEVLRCIPAAWSIASPADLLAARLAGIDATLRRILGDEVDSAAVAEAADLARIAAGACTPEGRPLYAGHASLPWPDEPHLVLWHALSLLREHRGDGHIAAMVVEGVDGCEALVIHGATGEVPAEILKSSRVRSDEDWSAAEARLRDRGWLDDDGGADRRRPGPPPVGRGPHRSAGGRSLAAPRPRRLHPPARAGAAPVEGGRHLRLLRLPPRPVTPKTTEPGPLGALRRA